MLTTAEVNKLFDLLKELHGKDKPRDKRTIAIWSTVLEPWTYQQVRMAVVERARENRYYPDPAEITAFLPQPEMPYKSTTAAGATVPQPCSGTDARAKEAQDSLFARMKKERERLIPLRRAAGIPATFEEALAVGMTAGKWWSRCEAAGLNYTGSVFREEVFYGTT